MTSRRERCGEEAFRQETLDGRGGPKIRARGCATRSPTRGEGRRRSVSPRREDVRHGVRDTGTRNTRMRDLSGRRSERGKGRFEWNRGRTREESILVRNRDRVRDSEDPLAGLGEVPVGRWKSERDGNGRVGRGNRRMGRRWKAPTPSFQVEISWVEWAGRRESSFLTATRQIAREISLSSCSTGLVLLHAS